MSKTAIIIIVAILVVAIVVFFVMRSRAKAAEAQAQMAAASAQTQTTGGGSSFLSFVGALLPTIMQATQKPAEPTKEAIPYRLPPARTNTRVATLGGYVS